MYIGNRHGATATRIDELPFDCHHCGHYQGVVVQGIGAGSAQSPFFLREKAAAEEARDAAVTAAEADMLTTIGLTPCPTRRRINVA